MVANPMTGTVPVFYSPVTSYKQGEQHSLTHHADDLIVPYGTPVYASATGTVSYVGNDGALGDTVKINHGNGWTTVYGNLGNIAVRKGETVQAQHQIATSDGRTDSPHPGDSTGQHLPFQIIHNGIYQNPAAYINAAGAATIGDYIQAGEDGIMGGTSSPFSVFGTIGTFLSTKSNWVRIGIGGLGVFLLIIAITRILSQTDTGKAVISSAKTAGEAAVLA